MLSEIRYLARLVLGVLRPPRPVAAARPRGARTVCGPPLLGSSVLVLAGWLGADAARHDVPVVKVLKGRAAEVQAAYEKGGLSHERDVAPIERVLLQYRNEPELVRRIAV